MENHPIPQDITGFQFKLIGSMTVRQFVYLAIVVLIGWVISFLLPIPHIISWPISIFILVVGIIFTFVPVDGRPMDTMLINLIHAMLSPTQYIYGKQGGDISKAGEKQPESKTPPPSVIQLPAPAQENVHQQIPNTPLMQTVEVNAVQAIPTAMPAPAIQPQPIQPQAVQPSADDLSQAQAEAAQQQAIEDQEKAKVEQEEKKIDEQTALIQKQIEANKTLEQSAGGDPTVSNQKISELEKMLAETIRQKEELEREVLEINAKLSHNHQPAVVPTQPSQNPTSQVPTEDRVKQVTPAQAPDAGIPQAPEAPNLITGIVKDPRGNPLQNILVEVKDEEDNPVRAFKTNGLGQFASATSVSNGKYFLTFEDPKEENRFDTVEVEAVGHPIMPVVIISIDKREELRRELFK